MITASRFPLPAGSLVKVTSPGCADILFRVDRIIDRGDRYACGVVVIAEAQYAPGHAIKDWRGIESDARPRFEAAPETVQELTPAEILAWTLRPWRA